MCVRVRETERQREQIILDLLAPCVALQTTCWLVGATASSAVWLRPLTPAVLRLGLELSTLELLIQSRGPLGLDVNTARLAALTG